jgi:hypothetical protein
MSFYEINLQNIFNGNPQADSRKSLFLGLNGGLIQKIKQILTDKSLKLIIYKKGTAMVEGGP